MESLMSMAPFDHPKNRPEFVHVDEKYQCPICGGMLLNPVQTPCGHRICEQPCLEELLRGKEQAECPVSDEYCEPITRDTVFKDVCARREIQAFKVYCSNKKHGCDERLQLGHLKRHLEECMFAVVPCTNAPLGCSQLIPRCRLHLHASTCPFRPTPCSKCGETVPLDSLQYHLQEQCRGVEIACSLGCGKKVLREEMADHEAQCDFKIICCEYKTSGCNFKGNRLQMTDHMKVGMELHLQLATRKIASLELQGSQQQRQNQELTNELVWIKHTCSELQKKNDELQETSQLQERKILTLHLSMSEIQKENERLREESKKQAEKTTQIEVQVRNLETSRATHEHRIEQVENSSRQNAVTNAGANSNGSTKNFERQVGIHDVRLAEVDLRFQLLETANYDGVLLWKIRDFSRRKIDAVNRKTLSLYSQPFYTSRHGYKMCARVYLNGDGVGKGTHMSLFFVIMRGEYDALLPWPFKQKVTFMLLDQKGRRHITDSFRPDPTSSSFKRPTSEMNVASGCPLFSPHELFQNKDYCDDETIFIKVVVDRSNLT